jgi:hypothetical protein
MIAMAACADPNEPAPDAVIEQAPSLDGTVFECDSLAQPQLQEEWCWPDDHMDLVGYSCGPAALGQPLVRATRCHYDCVDQSYCYAFNGCYCP